MSKAQAKFDANADIDFVIIGAGAAGGIIAKELSAAGFRIVVLEQGPYLKEQDFDHDELKYMRQRAITNDYNRQPNTFRATVKEKAKLQPAIIYGRQVGGGTVHFTANYWRFHEIDFNEYSRWGSIAGSGFADWPITYAELEPYYTKTEWELGVSGLAGASPFDPPRSKPYPVPPLPIKSSGALAELGAKKLGWHAFPAPLAIISQPYRGRSACLHCGFCEYFGCEAKAKSSTLATVIREAEATGKCEIRTNSCVRKIEIDKAGLVTGVTYFDEKRQEHFQRAKAVIVCANGAETPRLLLMSKSPQFPHGLANSSGKVGKYLMFNGHAQASALYEHPLNEFKSVAVSRVIHDFYDSDPKRGFYGGGGIDMRFVSYPMQFALRGFQADAPRWGPEFKKMLRERFTRTVNASGHTTSLPVEANSISLDPNVKDAYGLPAVRVTYKDHPEDMKTMQFFQARCKELLEATAAKKVWARELRNQTFGYHLLGTCRMGNDPHNSVVDKYHRAHDVPNLFICDGSSFVTSGRGQPTCTIQALAFRASDHIVRMAKSGEIKSAI
ncbi:MAG TPA: GMC family oxidoreductase [Blastocatellia bacterium]|nr:GMC family oxidoreductase [Blastocatellia bacterium]